MSYAPLPSSTVPPPPQASRFSLPLPWSSNSASSSDGSSAYSKPSFLQAITARPLRLLAWSALAVVTILLFAGGMGHGVAAPHVQRIGSYTSEKFWESRQAPSPWRELPQNEGLLDHTFEKDPDTGLLMPPDVYPAALNPFKRANAALVGLVRNNEKDAMRRSMESVEAKFNRKFGYPWVFLNDEPFTEDFKKGVLAMTRSEVTFATIPKEHWSYPDWVNQTLAKEGRDQMVAENVIYGGSESYRHMCRFNSGFFFKQEVLQQYDYYWRVEPGIELHCDVDYDPFVFMGANNKVYGFTIALYEYRRTIESLWQTVRDFAKLHPEHIAKDNSINFLVDDASKGLDAEYNLCHFWSNFEIGDMRFWRGQAYQDFFEYLDKTGNFAYERWGDAPVHSIAAALFVPSNQIHQFDDIAYRHNPYMHCPTNRAKYIDSGRCDCDPAQSFDLDGYSCMRQWWRVGDKPV